MYTPTLNRALLLILFSLFCFSSSFAQITGIVKDATTGSPLPNANVILVGTDFGAASDVHGNYVIEQVPAGEYVIKASYMGYESEEKSIAVQEGASLQVNFELREQFFQMQHVVVTATRDVRLLENVPVVTEVVTREEIEEKGAEDLSEILEDRAGIMVETGTSGDNLLYMNGVDSKRILILVDGLPISGKVNSRIPVNLVDADNIQHIEIVKGPGSPLYGSDAMGGVINIITKDYTKDLTINANGRIGSDELYSGNLNVSGATRNFAYLLGADYVTRGFDQASSEIQINDSKSNGLNGKLSYDNGSIGRFEFKSSYKQDEQNSESVVMGGLSNNTAKVDRLDADVKWDWKTTKYLDVKLNPYMSNNERTYETVRENSTSASIDTTTEKMWGLKSDFTLKPVSWAKLDFGMDYLSNSYNNQRLPEPKDRSHNGVFFQLEAQVKKVNLIVGGRYDKITDIDGHFSPRLSALVSFTPDFKLRASYGGGFRAPSFIELYSDFPMPIPGVPLRVVGNENLRPEESLGGNVGVEYFWNNRILTNITLFQNRFEDMIVDYQKDRFTYSYLNTESATFQGVEIQSRISVSKAFKTTISYNYTDIAQKEKDVAFSKISPHTAFVRLAYGLFGNKLKFSLRGQYFSARDILVVTGHGGGYSKVRKDPYTTLDATLSYRMNSMLTLRTGATNLTDYIDENYGPYMGRRLFVGCDAGI